MTDTFKAIKITDNVYWVGAIDWSIRNFHGYSTTRGTTYNAYLILADKVTLIDTVKNNFKRELLARIASVTAPENIHYIISNHAELDHSGCLPAVIETVKPEKVFASKLGVRTLADHFSSDLNIEAVKDGESKGLGNMTLTFMDTRMLHWPESMITYLHEERVLFSQDAFGMHLASTERFDTDIDDTILKNEAAKYFANILLPFSPRVAKILTKLKESALEIDMIAPDHGPVWQSGVDTIVNYYQMWAEKKRSQKALVLYDTMWQSTAVMAQAITDGLLAGGAKPRVIPVGDTHRSDIATELLDAGALVMGSPTLNNNLFPTVADVLTYIKGLKPQKLVGAAFGSYGWSGEAVSQILEMMKNMKIDVIDQGLKVKYVPKEKDLALCFDLGLQVAEKLSEFCRDQEE